VGALMVWADRGSRLRVAREALTPIAAILPLEYATARNDLTERHAQWMMDHGDAVGALALIGEVPVEERGREMAALFRRAYHLVALAGIESDDAIGLLRHARWCAENELLSEALELFAQTRQNPNLRELSDELIRMTRAQRDTEMLEQARSMQVDGDHAGVLARTSALLLNPGLESDLTREAEALDRISRQALRRDSERRPFEAIVLYQRAERAYFMGELSESLELLRILIRQFPDTPAASMAGRLQPDVMRAVEIAMLEGRRTNLPPIPGDLPVGMMENADRLSEEIRRMSAAETATRPRP